jgi:AcrR family transcriptional regulator
VPATKDQIAQTFHRHVERYGYGKASVEDVAAELGISKRTIYQHFSSKKELYAYVIEGIAAQQRQQLEAMIADDSTYSAKMRHFLTLVVGGMRVHIQQTSKSDWMQEFEIAFDAMAGAYGAIGTVLVAKGHEAGEFEFADAALANELIGALVTHYGVMVRDDLAYDADEAVVDALMRMLGAKTVNGEDGR